MTTADTVKATELNPALIPLDDSLLALPLREARDNFERSYLSAVLMRFAGNITHAAVAVGMERAALHRKLRQLGVVLEEIRTATAGTIARVPKENFWTDEKKLSILTRIEEADDEEAERARLCREYKIKPPHLNTILWQARRLRAPALAAKKRHESKWGYGAVMPKFVDQRKSRPAKRDEILTYCRNADVRVALINGDLHHQGRVITDMQLLTLANAERSRAKLPPFHLEGVPK